MTNIDELFKKPTVPSKRKFKAPSHDPSAFYKTPKNNINGTASRGNDFSTTVEDEAPEVDDEDEAGPSRPPPGQDEEDIADEEGGRFFGGGIGENTKEVLDFMDQQDGDADTAPEVIDSAWLRKLALNFERRVSKNAELRGKFEDQPEKFMTSEADLDADIKAISILSEHPELYEEFAKVGCVASLVSLLSHENTDISIDTIEIIDELTDEDVEAEESQWFSIVNAMMEADLLSLLVSNLARFDENIESDRSGVYHTLAILENLSSNPSIAAKIGTVTPILNYLSSRFQNSETSPSVSQNKQYAAEIFAILLQSTPQTATNFLSLSTGSKDSTANPLDSILQILSRYRRRDPAPSTDEEEYVENLFDALTCLVDTPLGKHHFLSSEGIELCVILLKESKFARSRAVRVLDHALSASSNTPPDADDDPPSSPRDPPSLDPPELLATRSATRLVLEAQGLGVIFKAFMKTTSPKKAEKETRAFLEHLLGIFSSLLRWLPPASPERIRILAKFVEKDFEKIGRLVGVRGHAARRVGRVEDEIRAEREEMDRDGAEKPGEEERAVRESEWMGRRLDAGLFSLQTVDLVLAWCVAEDEGCRARARELLGGGFEDLKKTLRQQVDEMEGDGDGAREMIETLLACL